VTIRLHNPSKIAAPFSRYSHGVSAPVDARWLHISGQIGATPQGGIPDDPERQMELAWDNLLAVLDDAGMSVTDLVKVDGFVVRPGLIPLYRTVRERRLGGHAAASTLVVVSALVVPSLLVEIQAVAAR
jgi:enamine deaminase RidA (YjgF/YER057c/UK114 family)